MAAKKKATAKAEKTTVNEQPQAQAPEAGVNEDAQLTIVDLQTLAQAIDIASRRGAFGASEMGDVGAVYNKLTTFLQLIADQQKAASQGAGE